jgi:hypothetical protein
LLLVVGPFADEDIVCVLLLLARTPKVSCDLTKVILSLSRVSLLIFYLSHIETFHLLRVFDRGCHPLGLFAVPPDL